MAEKIYYFIDTRDGAKTDEKFGITNPDVAKSWTRDYNNGTGPFKPAGEEVFQKNRRDLHEEIDGPLNVKIEADQTKENLAVIEADHMTVTDYTYTPVDNAGGSAYEGMTKTELQNELDGRGVDYKKSGPESTKEEYIRLLEADDAGDSNE